MLLVASVCVCGLTLAFVVAVVWFVMLFWRVGWRCFFDLSDCCDSIYNWFAVCLLVMCLVFLWFLLFVVFDLVFWFMVCYFIAFLVC